MKPRTYMLLSAVLFLAGLGCPGKEAPSPSPGPEPEAMRADDSKVTPAPSYASLRAEFDSRRKKYDAIFKKLEGKGIDLADLRLEKEGVERKIEGKLASLQGAQEQNREPGDPLGAETQELAELETTMARYRNLDERAWKRLHAHVDREIREKGLETIMKDILRKKGN